MGHKLRIVLWLREIMTGINEEALIIMTTTNFSSGPITTGPLQGKGLGTSLFSGHNVTDPLSLGEHHLNATFPAYQNATFVIITNAK